MGSLTRELTTMPRVSYVRRIVADIQDKVSSGALKPGAKLPTVDRLAEEYGCSTTPVKTAVRMLEASGVIETQPGKGMYVAGSPAEGPT